MNNDNRNILIGVVVIALIAGAYYFGTMSKETAQAPVPAETGATSQQVDNQPTPQPAKSAASSNVADNSTLLANKAKCASYQEQEEKDAASYYPLGIVAVHRIFYSPTRNSCIVMKYTLNTNNVDGELLQIEDILDGTLIWSQYYPQAMKYWEAGAILDNQAKAHGLE